MNLSSSNSTDDDVPTIDQHLFDLLADGELDEFGRRELLACLDDAPDGWRRCALAFLEAQSFKTEFRGLLDERPTNVPASPPVTGRLPRHGAWKTFVAVAASFLIALGLGVGLRDAFGPRDRPGAAGVEVAESARTPPSSGTGPDASAVARSDAVETPVGEPPAAQVLTVEADSWQLVSFSLGDESAQGGESIRLPAIERESIDEAWLKSLPRPIPPDMLRVFENLGHRVRQNRRLLPIRMNDGRRLVVPVDQIELHYVDNRVSQ